VKDENEDPIADSHKYEYFESMNELSTVERTWGPWSYAEIHTAEPSIPEPSSRLKILLTRLKRYKSPEGKCGLGHLIPSKRLFVHHVCDFTSITTFTHVNGFIK